MKLLTKSLRYMVPMMLLMLLTSMLAAQDKTQQSGQTDARQTSHQIEVQFSSGNKKPLHFLQYLPAAYAAEGKAKPLMLFLHGRGECGQDIELVKTWGPPRLVESKNDFPFIVISPQCETPGWDSTALKELLDHVVRELNVDMNRIYVTGLSMGGYGTWDFVAENADLVAAAIPICGGGHARTAEALQNLPIWAFHGDADTVVPLRESQNMVNAIRELNADNVKLTIYEGVGHNSWEQTYANQEIYDWLLQHQRKSRDE